MYIGLSLKNIDWPQICRHLKMLSWIDAPSALKEKKYYEKIIIPIMINKDVGGANNPSVNVTYTPGGTKEPLSTQKSDKSPGMSFESTPPPIDSTSPDSILHEDGNKKPVKGSQEWIEKKTGMKY